MTAKTVRRLLRDNALEEPTPGVLVVVGSPDTWHRKLYVASLASNAAGRAAGRAAAALHEMDEHPQGPIELVLPSNRHIDLPELVTWQGPFDARDFVEIDGIRCTGVARTLCDLGTIEDPALQKLAFEWAWRSGKHLDWMEQTARRLDNQRTCGPRLLLALIEEARRHGRPTGSALEVKVEQVLAALPGVVRQHVVSSSSGVFIARPDFAIPHLKIAIEAHSRRHHFAMDAVHADADRENALQGEGWVVRFVTDAQRRRPDKLRQSLLALIAARELGSAT